MDSIWTAPIPLTNTLLLHYNIKYRGVLYCNNFTEANCRKKPHGYAAFGFVGHGEGKVLRVGWWCPRVL